jgi:Holliday junction DNA helicase RuvA
MYEYLKGKLVEAAPAYAVADVNGIGYFIRISLFTYEKIAGAKEVMLYTEFIVREDGHFLFGFIDRGEREIFRQLIGISGIGSNTAMLMLSALPPETLKEAIVNEDVAALKAIKGVGPKTAKRIIVELKDKILKDFTPFSGENVSSVRTPVFDEAVKALEVLGYPRRVTEKTIRTLLQENPALTTEQIIKAVLKRL